LKYFERRHFGKRKMESDVKWILRNSKSITEIGAGNERCENEMESGK
jgi:hypothetical protein